MHYLCNRYDALPLPPLMLTRALPAMHYPLPPPLHRLLPLLIHYLLPLLIHYLRHRCHASPTPLL
jgi:hypothetical protein